MIYYETFCPIIESLDKGSVRNSVSLFRNKKHKWVENHPDKNMPVWMQLQFGKQFEKTIEEIYAHRPMKCQICGKEIGLDEEIVQLTFSFCDEYGCGIVYHPNCATGEELK